MKTNDLFKLIQSPVISEKSTQIAEVDNRIVFRVNKKATKLDIKQAIEKMFGVEVESVNVLNVKGKKKRFGRFMGARSDWKKAYVKLKEGFKIELAAA
jgi:large subunit ribosomal protein L23